MSTYQVVPRLDRGIQKNNYTHIALDPAVDAAGRLIKIITLPTPFSVFGSIKRLR